MKVAKAFKDCKENKNDLNIFVRAHKASQAFVIDFNWKTHFENGISFIRFVCYGAEKEISWE